jgi:hypothetical protein
MKPTPASVVGASMNKIVRSNERVECNDSNMCATREAARAFVVPRDQADVVIRIKLNCMALKITIEELSEAKEFDKSA